MPLQLSYPCVGLSVPALLLLSLFLFVPAIHSQNVDCDQYDDDGFTFLEVSETGLITFDNLGEGYPTR